MNAAAQQRPDGESRGAREGGWSRGVGGGEKMSRESNKVAAPKQGGENLVISPVGPGGKQRPVCGCPCVFGKGGGGGYG